MTTSRHNQQPEKIDFVWQRTRQRRVPLGVKAPFSGNREGQNAYAQAA